MELLDNILRILYAEKEKIDKAIAILEGYEARQDSHITIPLKRRGRKSMGEDERKQVSSRIKKYWADRKRREALERGKLRAAARAPTPKI